MVNNNYSRCSTIRSAEYKPRWLAKILIRLQGDDVHQRLVRLDHMLEAHLKKAHPSCHYTGLVKHDEDEDDKYKYTKYRRMPPAVPVRVLPATRVFHNRQLSTFAQSLRGRFKTQARVIVRPKIITLYG